MTVRVSVAIADPECQHVIDLALPEGSRVADALAAPEVRELLGGRDVAAVAVGIWSRRCAHDAPLREGDRVEVYRELAADPKAMRRDRARLKPSTRSRRGR